MICWDQKGKEEKSMKKRFVGLLAVVLVLFGFTACGGAASGAAADKMEIAETFTVKRNIMDFDVAASRIEFRIFGRNIAGFYAVSYIHGDLFVCKGPGEKHILTRSPPDTGSYIFLPEV